jgi:hypothetical protein
MEHMETTNLVHKMDLEEELVDQFNLQHSIYVEVIKMV